MEHTGANGEQASRIRTTSFEMAIRFDRPTKPPAPTMKPRRPNQPVTSSSFVARKPRHMIGIAANPIISTKTNRAIRAVLCTIAVVKTRPASVYAAIEIRDHWIT